MGRKFRYQPVDLGMRRGIFLACTGPIDLLLLTSFLTNDLALNDCLSDSSGCMSNTSVPLVMAKERETTQDNTTELRSSKANMAAPMHQGTAREKVVNTNRPFCSRLCRK